MDNRLKIIFFKLLRLGLWGGDASELSESLSSEDWSIIRFYSMNHTVEGLIYDSFSFLDEHQLPPQPLRLKWAVRIDQIEKYNEKINHTIAEQYKSFREYGLCPILQKGQGVACHYNIPNHRMSGDIDWYFENEGFAKARDFLNAQNQGFYNTAGFSLEYDQNGIHIEHHKMLFDIRNPFKKKYLEKIQTEYKDSKQTLLINGTHVQLLAPELQLLQVNAHILKHLISFGIGLRQFCDSARLYHAMCHQINPTSLKQLYKKAGILNWSHLLHKFLVEFIGLPYNVLPFPYPNNLKIDWMTEEIWNSGNFGFYDSRYENDKIISTISVRPNGGVRLWNNFLRYFKYAPQEVAFFPIMHTFSKFWDTSKDKPQL